MKKIRLVVTVGFILFIFPVIAFCDEKITLSTYYPAPYGEYRTLAVGDTYTAPAAGGNTSLVVQDRVGVGTTNPATMLHLRGTASDAFILERLVNNQTWGVGTLYRLRDSASNSHDYAGIYGLIETNTNGSERGGIVFYTASPALSEKVRITGRGNVGIGISSPSGTLDVYSRQYGQIRIYGGADGTNYWPSLILHDNAPDGATWSIDNGYTTWGGGKLVFNCGAYPACMIMDGPTGNVGIGKTDPAGKLHVVDNLATSNGILIERNGGSPRLGLVDTSVTGSPAWYIDNNADTFRIFRQPNISTGGTAHFLIDNQGRVGIGWNPSDATAASRDSILHIDPDRLPILWAPINFSESLAVVTVGNERGHIFRVSGSASSERYKENIKPYKDDFYKILNVTPKSFDFKKEYRPSDSPTYKEVGYIAEDFMKIGLQNLVVNNEKNQPDKIRKELIPIYTLEIVKVHNNEIENLKNTVAKLQKEIEDLKKNNR